MEIVQVIGMASGGVLTHVIQLSELLLEADHRVKVIAPEEVLLPVPGVKRKNLRIGSRPSLHDFKQIKQLSQLLIGADLVHAHGLRAGVFCVKARRLLKEQIRPALVVTEHNLPLGSKRIALVGQHLARLVAKEADYLLAVSPDLVQQAEMMGAKGCELAKIPAPKPGWLIATGPEVVLKHPDLQAGLKRPDPKQLPADQIKAAPALSLEGQRRPRNESSCDPDAGEEKTVVQSETGDFAGQFPDAQLPYRRLELLTVARLAPQKGLDLLLLVAAELSRQGIEYRWQVAGDGPLASALRLEAEALGVPVQFIGYQGKVRQLIRKADLVVQTSRWEGQPVALQEALQEGAAIVATEVGGTKAVVGQAARLVPLDALEIAQAINRLRLQPQRLGHLRELSRQRASQLPGPQDLLSQVEAVYAQVLKQY